VAGRPEKPVTGSGPLCDFARDLRALRSASGMTYEELARRAHYSKTSLHEAARGKQLPSLELTLAFARGCGADEEYWRGYWYRVRATAGLPDAMPPGVPAQYEEPRPPGPGSNRRPVWWLAIAAAIVALTAVGWFVVTQSPPPRSVSDPYQESRQAWRSEPEVPPTPGKPADAMDPIRSGCGSPEVAAQIITLDEVPVRLPSNADFGVLRLRNQPGCQASWGQVLGPHGPDRRVHIIARRPADHVAAPSDFAGTYSNSYGNLLLTKPGCVYVEAFVETPEGNGPTARTRCA
jgi:transcriptional regulator with XRE-family HTH domain